MTLWPTGVNIIGQAHHDLTRSTGPYFVAGRCAVVTQHLQLATKKVHHGVFVPNTTTFLEDFAIMNVVIQIRHVCN
jgi:hypothetical protein